MFTSLERVLVNPWPDACEAVISSADEAGWLDARASTIGASEIASAAMVPGAFLSRAQLWALLKGYPRTDVVKPMDNDMLLLGRCFEAGVAEAFRLKAEDTGITLHHSGIMYRSHEYPSATATLDYFATHPDWPNAIPAEIKTATDYVEEDWTGGVPEKYYVQVQWQMYVTGAPSALVIVAVSNRRLMWQWVERDEFVIKRLLRQAARMFELVALDKCPPDSHKSTAAVITAIHSDPEGHVDINDIDVADAAEKYLHHKERAAWHEDKKRYYENEIRTEVGDYKTADIIGAETYHVSLPVVRIKEHVRKATEYRRATIKRAK